MKIKSLLIFSGILIIFMCFYYLLMNNIDIFLTNYDNKILTFNNKINLDNQNDNIISMILGSEADIEVATEEDIKPLINNEFMINILSNLMEISQEEVKTDLNF